MLDKIRIVLINTTHPGNIGSAARAMKTMGFKQLYLVSPQQFPHPKAYELASGAKDILDNAQIVASLDEAIADCQLVLGTSARERAIPWPLMSVREAANFSAKEACNNDIAILFGREQSGLNNDELERCHIHIHIPTDQTYSSLNLAAAVQVITYEFRLQLVNIEKNPHKRWDYRLANKEEMAHFFEHLQETLVKIQFIKANAPRKSMTRLKRLFLRTRLDIMEVNMLRGILTAIDKNQ